MSITSEYFFGQGLYAGIFLGINTQDPVPQGFSNTSVASNGVWTTTIHRPSTEQAVDLAGQINTPGVQGIVALALSQAGAVLTSQIRVQGVPWQFVPYFFKSPQRHKINDMLVRVDFDFHLETPGYCSDADGTISVYLFLFIQDGRLKGNVDGGWFQYTGGELICTGSITSALNAAMPGIEAKVKPLLDAAVAKAQAKADAFGIKFARLYYLPGTAAATQVIGGPFPGDASADVTLALLPA